MGRVLSQEEFQQRFDTKYKGKVSLVSPYVNKLTPVLVQCVECGHEYSVTPNTILYKNHPPMACFNCSHPVVTCDFCGKEFRKNRSEVTKTSKSYCSIHCRNQALNDAKRRPSINNYRAVAFANYEHKCAVCGWDEDEDILEVHHIDENRRHNELENLIILCPICHRKLTSKKYKLVGNTIIGA